MSKPTPSLSLSLSSDARRVRLASRLGMESGLRRLAGGFHTSQQWSATLVEVDFDDLLTNLDQLARWPEPDVIWEPSLRTLVLDSLEDARAVASQLSDDGVAASIGPDDVQSLLGEGWTGALTPFQKRDIAKLLSLRHGANFSVPGAGKTRVGLAVFQAMRVQEGIERLLIVGPKSSYDSWIQENQKCLKNPQNLLVVEGTPRFDADILVINYERLPNLVTELAGWLADRPSMLILDEAHRMKLGADGAYGSACLALGPQAQRRLILTGTPAPNGVRDLENLFGFVWPGNGRQSVARAVNGGDLAAASLALKPLFTRTTKGELDLPPVTTKIRSVQLPPLHAEIYDALVGHFSARAIGQEDNFQALGRIMMYMMMAATSPALLAVGSTRHEALEYQVPPLTVPEDSSLFGLMQDLPAYEMSPKYQEVIAIVRENASQGKKTLVWSTFVRSLNTLERMLTAFKPAIVHGGTADRETQIQRFREDKECMVLLSNPATLGEGISLHHECHDAVYVDRDFAAGRFLQSLDRIHRLGLAPGTETQITVLVSENTIDEVVAERLARKLEFMGQILDDPAVQQLADLAEEPAVGGGLSLGDLSAVIDHLHAHTS